MTGSDEETRRSENVPVLFRRQRPGLSGTP